MVSCIVITRIISGRLVGWCVPNCVVTSLISELRTHKGCQGDASEWRLKTAILRASIRAIGQRLQSNERKPSLRYGLSSLRDEGRVLGHSQPLLPCQISVPGTTEPSHNLDSGQNCPLAHPPKFLTLRFHQRQIVPCLPEGLPPPEKMS